MMAMKKMKQKLQAWSTATLKVVRELDSAGVKLNDTNVVMALKQGTLFQEPASAEMIDALERKLCKPLPPSYKEFLECTNGWLLIDACNYSYRLVPIDEVGFFCEKLPGLCEPLESYSDVPDDEYYVYGEEQKPDALRASYLTSLVLISSDDSPINYLLNPSVIFDDGEWEAWAYSSEDFDGAIRYQSFIKLLEAEHLRLADLLLEYLGDAQHANEDDAFNRVQEYVKEGSLEEAEELCFNLANEGHAEAMSMMATIHTLKSDQPNWSEVEKWEIMAAEKGCPYSPTVLSGLYMGPELDEFFDYKYPPDKYPLTNWTRSLVWHCVSLITEGSCKANNRICLMKEMMRFIDNLKSFEDLDQRIPTDKDAEQAIDMALEWLEKYWN